jgi:hypothetical protein
LSPRPPRLEADQEHAASLVGLEAGDSLGPVARLAVEVLVDDPTLVEAFAHDRQQARELGEHQRLLPLLA